MHAVEFADFRHATEKSIGRVGFAGPICMAPKLLDLVVDERGNLYKCSGPALHEHYGCWNAVGTAAPDFHRPEYFGDMLIEPKDR